MRLIFAIALVALSSLGAAQKTSVVGTWFGRITSSPIKSNGPSMRYTLILGGDHKAKMVGSLPDTRGRLAPLITQLGTWTLKGDHVVSTFTKINGQAGHSAAFDLKLQRNGKELSGKSLVGSTISFVKGR